MDNQRLVSQILSTAASARRSGQEVEIDNMLPTVSVTRGEDDNFFFQEHEATSLLERASSLIHSLGDPADLGEDDVILYMAQGW